MTKLFDSNISRRRLIGYAAAFGAAGVTGMLMPGTAFGQSETPARGGTLTANMKDPPNFDIIGNSTSWVILTVGPCYNGLIVNDPANPGSFIGDLAESWVVSPDGRTVTFTLRKGVQFHDGMPFTSADVKHTFDLAWNPPEGVVSIRQSTLSAIDSIEAPDEHTVIFRLKRAQPSFLPLLATGWMVVLPKHILEAEGTMANTVIGTGPYKFVDYQRGVKLELVRNDSYHVPELPYLDGITFYVAEDPSTLDAYFQTGQITFYNEMSSDSGLRFETSNDPALTVQRVVTPNPTAITLNGTRGPWADKRVRQAASYAVDRREAIALLEKGQAVVGGFLPPGRYALPEDRLAAMPGYGPDKQANLEKARALLAEAGFPDGFEGKMLVRKNGAHEARAVVVQGMLKEVGINLTLDVQESAMFFDNFNAANFEIVSQGGISYPVEDPEVVFGTIHTRGPGNISGVFNDEIDRLFEEQLLETDDEKRVEIARKMEEIALNEVSRIVLCYKNKFIGHASKVHGYVGTGNPDDVSRLEGVWIA